MPWVIFILTVLHTGITSDAQSLTLKMNSAVPLKSSSLVLSCQLSISFTSGVTQLWKGTETVADCASRDYGCSFFSGYNSIANQTGVFTTISSLNRENEGTYKCSYIKYPLDIWSDSLTLVAYTIPSRLDFRQVPYMNIDLSVTSAQLQCTTSGCTYPPPLIQWLTQGQTASSPYEVYKTLNPTGSAGSCILPEQLYTSTLVFQQNTTWSDNSDKILIFSCRIEYPDSTMNLITSGSQTITFAVRVTEAFLQQNNQNITSNLTVIAGEQVTLACVTGTSRPAANIGWYIGSRSMGSGTSLIFTPSNTDHNQIIYCQAYNIDLNLKVDSKKPSLFVRVRVTEAFLQHNNQNITSTLTVTSGEQVTLVCVTGASRPAPNIGWYLGSQSIGSGTNLIFIPSNTDHNQVIFCQAYNIDPSRKVDSNKSKLFVQVRVTEAVLQQNGQTIANATLIVTSGKPTTLSCVTGNSRPAANIDWYIGFQKRGNGTSMKFIPTNEDHGKAICCQAYNIDPNRPVMSNKPVLFVRVTPEKPINFHAANIQEKQLSLRWQSGYDGGLTQTFVVEISLDNITWNNVSEVTAGNRDGWFSTVIEDLMPGSDYYLRLYAYNVNGRGDFADVQLVIRMLKEISLEVGASVGIGVGGAVGIGVGGIFLGLIPALIACTIRRQLNGPTNSCFRSQGKTDEEMHTYSNTEMNPQTVKPIYEELNKGNTERSVYDKISSL